ncbi:ANTAR domain-containing protein [Nakamurella flavida]|uniref:ANTAR domain-containing protein n=1 Tax=Nakamurella flavida TaxID=363630 RepID=A0A938YNU2_9ACTN|nr:GAF domain-containing protein [Nakamurella flavida]MBM9477971.1 ANTAR domain-containing protein [Nakamurella flavida]MDP9778313.1 hypothetical protein [Nakamurella flavida]
MNVVEEFAAAMDAVTGRSRAEHSALLPNKLAWACVRVLGVSGASLSVSTDPDLRIPLGASSEAASTAESLQYTTGTGPCLDAHATGVAVLAPEPVLARRWPVYHLHLVHRTAFRAVHALPLRGGLTGIGTLDLYFESDAALAAHDPRAAEAVADAVAAALLADPAAAGTGEPIWLNSPLARARTTVAIAVGMVVIDQDLSPATALELIRGHARGLESTVDLIARQIVDRALTPAALTADAHTAAIAAGGSPVLDLPVADDGPMPLTTTDVQPH